MASFLDILTIRDLDIGKFFGLSVTAAVSEQELLTSYLRSVSKMFLKRLS